MLRAMNIHKYSRIFVLSPRLHGQRTFVTSCSYNEYSCGHVDSRQCLWIFSQLSWDDDTESGVTLAVMSWAVQQADMPPTGQPAAGLSSWIFTRQQFDVVFEANPSCYWLVAARQVVQTRVVVAAGLLLLLLLLLFVSSLHVVRVRDDLTSVRDCLNVVLVLVRRLVQSTLYTAHTNNQHPVYTTHTHTNRQNTQPCILTSRQDTIQWRITYRIEIHKRMRITVQNLVTSFLGHVRPLHKIRW